MSFSVATRTLSKNLSIRAFVKKQYVCLHCLSFKEGLSTQLLKLHNWCALFDNLAFVQFHKVHCRTGFYLFTFSLKQTCLGVYKCINVPCVIKMDFVSLGWLSNLFLFLASFILPHTSSSDFDVLRIIYSSSAFSKYVSYSLVNQNCCFETFIFLFA